MKEAQREDDGETDGRKEGPGGKGVSNWAEGVEGRVEGGEQ